MVVAEKRHYPAKTINLYGELERELWEAVEEQIRAKHDGENANEGEVAAQAFADLVNRDGPLDGESA